MRWLIQIRDLDVDDDQLKAVRAGISALLLEQGVGGRMLTAQAWMVEAIEQLPKQPRVAQGNNNAAPITEPRMRLQ